MLDVVNREGFIIGKIDRTGEEKINNFGSKMRIINYRGANDIDVYFEEYNWIAKNKGYKEFKLGSTSCPYEARFYGMGYIGEGKYNSNSNKNIFSRWHNMLKRCYDSEYQEKHPSYKGCEVCDKWLNFQNFAKWFEENYYEVNNEKMELDKDIIIKGNKLYSSITCVFVPQRINKLFTKRQNDRGDYPIGVSPYKDKFIARCNNTSSKLGYYNTPEEAFQTYKTYKENLIKEIAEEYKNEIPEVLYKSLYKYEVEITD